MRRLLLEGRVETAAQLLGRPYGLRGRVIPGRREGRQLGFPTANLQPISSYKLLPREGIYAVKAAIGKVSYAAAAYIGMRPTFNGTEKGVEVHVPGFAGDLYGREVELEFHAFLRPDHKFDSTDALVEQIRKDIKQAIDILEQGGQR